MNPEVWRGRRVLVTGHTGFKGSWLALWLKQLGAGVAGYALEPPSEPSLFVEARVGELVEDVRGDLADGGRLGETVSRCEPEVVFHLAAQALVRRGYEAPLETFETNALGTARVLEALRVAPSVRAVVVVTTDKCYDNREWAWGYRESDRLGGRDPYSASKACAELVTTAYRESFLAAGERPVGVATARAGNVLGGGDWGRDRLLPDLLRALAEGNCPLIRNPGAVRPWQHVLDPLAGYLALAEALLAEPAAFSAAWNFGPGDADARPVAWMADRVCELWGDGAAWERDRGDHPHEATSLRLDASLARSRLGWSPRIPLGKALEWVVEWHRLHLAGGDVRALSREQIDRYADLPG